MRVKSANKRENETIYQLLSAENIFVLLFIPESRDKPTQFRDELFRARFYFAESSTIEWKKTVYVCANVIKKQGS